jgi:hypothetical protein
VKLPIILRGPRGSMRKVWEAYGQAIFAIDGGRGGYWLLVDLAEVYLGEKEAVHFPRWEDAYYCLEAKHWEEPRRPFFYD